MEKKDAGMLELAEAVKKLIGDRSIRQTAKDTGIAASYLSGIMKGKYCPSAEILRKMTTTQSMPQNGVTLEMLMFLAGYIDNVTQMELTYSPPVIMSAIEMRKMAEENGRTRAVEKAVLSMMKKIELASQHGDCQTTFTPPMYVYDDVKQKFKANGYTFKPVGYEGGVWQDCEYICW